MQPQAQTSKAFVVVSWLALGLGVGAYMVGLWNAGNMQLNEKGYYLIVILYGLFAAVSIQKSIRDRHENIPVSSMYINLCWLSTVAAIALLVIGLWNATLSLSEKGFYGMAFALSLFAAIAVQKNTRDSLKLAETASGEPNLF